MMRWKDWRGQPVVAGYASWHYGRLESYLQAKQAEQDPDFDTMVVFEKEERP